MITWSIVPVRWARWSLLLAALVHLSGAAGESWLHLQVAHAETAERSPVPGGKSTPVPHHEQSCLLCHTLSQFPLPEVGSVPDPVVEVAAPLRAEQGPVHSPPLRRFWNARAPPVL